MKTSQFATVASKLINTNLIPVLQPRKHDQYLLGSSYIGATENQNKKLWQKYGTLENIIIFKDAETVNAILEVNCITEFKAKPTKSGTMSRLILNK